MFHYLYKIIKQDTGEFYIGVRSSRNKPEDDRSYLGSGKVISASVKKHGRDAFTKYIIAECQSRDDANSLEKQFVTDEILADPLCLNLILGGGGSAWVEKKRTHARKPQIWSEERRQQNSLRQLGVPKSKHKEEANKRKSERMKGIGFVMAPDVRAAATAKTAAKAKEAYASGARVHHYQGKHRSEEDRNKISASLIGHPPWNKGVTLSPEHRYKIGEVQRGKHDRIELELVKVGWNYEIFKEWVLALYRSGLGPIKIWRQLPPECKISDRPIKTIIKEHKCQTS